MFFRHLEGLLGLIVSPVQGPGNVFCDICYSVSVIITIYVYTLICDYRFQNIFYPYFFNEISQNFHVPVVCHTMQKLCFLTPP